MRGFALRVSFGLLVLAFALFHFADNVADPDLWGHVLFGQRMLHMRTVERTEPFSWTAPDAPWINHEALAEIALGAAHRLGGGTGILLLKTAVGMWTFLLALALGAERLDRPWRAVAWALGAVASVEISFGFAARPQIFSALGLAILLWILRRVFEGRPAWAMALPPLFAIWANTHGGALAGLLLSGVGFVAWSAESVLFRRKKDGASPSSGVLAWVGLAVVLSAAAMALNPWGLQLPAWLVESVRWVRPEIHEWNPVRLDIERAPFFILVVLTAAAFIMSRRSRRWWEMAVLGVLGVMAVRHVRHTPLFAIAALAFAPPHAADAIRRMRAHMARIEECFMHAQWQRFAVAVFLIAAAGCLVATGVLHKQHPWTMEVPGDTYPLSAVRFIREHELKGNLLVFFDWGELAIWELPDNPVSMDGRLDTCYPRTVIAAHWDLYRGIAPDPAVMDIRKADVALLRQDLNGADLLIRSFGWHLVYQDPLSVVLVRNPRAYSRLAGLALPVERGFDALEERAEFPAQPSANATPRAKNR